MKQVCLEMASVNSTPSERVNHQLNDTLLSANSSAFDVSGFSELPENFGISMNESLLNAALIDEEERISTLKRKCASQNPDYREFGDEFCDVDSDNDQSFVPPVESTPVAKQARYQSLSPFKKGW